jgi:hypothetical protein
MSHEGLPPERMHSLISSPGEVDVETWGTDILRSFCMYYVYYEQIEQIIYIYIIVIYYDLLCIYLYTMSICKYKYISWLLVYIYILWLFAHYIYILRTWYFFVLGVSPKLWVSILSWSNHLDDLGRSGVPQV